MYKKKISVEASRLGCMPDRSFRSRLKSKRGRSPGRSKLITKLRSRALSGLWIARSKYIGRAENVRSASRSKPTTLRLRQFCPSRRGPGFPKWSRHIFSFCASSDSRPKTGTAFQLSPFQAVLHKRRLHGANLAKSVQSSRRKPATKHSKVPDSMNSPLMAVDVVELDMLWTSLELALCGPSDPSASFQRCRA